MRAWFFGIVLLLGLPAAAVAGDDPFQAGIARLPVPAETPFEMLVWYPSQAAETPFQMGPFSIPATHNAPVSAGVFPVILLSHGGGVGGGSPLILREVSAQLARQGFIVVAPFHRQASLPTRTRQLGQALDALLADARFQHHADPQRLGMLGFSLGGAAALELAGARPDMPHFAAYCGSHKEDAMSCDHAPGSGGTGAQARPATSGGPKLALKAVVLLDPLAALFSPASLAAVTMPVLLVRPEQSQLPGEGNALALRTSLPHPPRYETVPGRHFVFTDTCPPALAAEAPELCRDPAGVDRAAVHRHVEMDVAAFFRDTLVPPQ